MKKVSTILLALFTVAMCQSVDELIIQGKEKIKLAVQNWNEQEMLAARAHFERTLTLNDKAWLVHY